MIGSVILGAGAVVFSGMAAIMWLMMIIGVREAIQDGHLKWDYVPWVGVTLTLGSTIMAAVCWYGVLY